MAKTETATSSLPSAGLLEEQASWLAPARSWLLRGVGIAQCRRVLDLGAGYGAVTTELVRRARGPVIAVDRQISALQAEDWSFVDTCRVGVDGLALPFVDESFDLVFSQLTLLWISPLAQVVQEIWRALVPGGALVALEPDYGGLMEYPPEIATRELWLTALARVGADPLVGRKLPCILADTGFELKIELLNRLSPPDPARFHFLRDLLMEEEQAQLEAIEAQAKRLDGSWDQVAHLPFFLITARKPEAI